MSEAGEGPDAGPIALSGAQLTPGLLTRIARGAPVSAAPEALARMGEAQAVLERGLAEGRAIYGVTTGLGPRVVEQLPDSAQATMSATTLRGRAHAVGAALPRDWVRAAMAVRLNTWLVGASGVSPRLAEHLARCLNGGVVPLVRESGSIGAADLPWGAAIGLALIGEGECLGPEGPEPAAESLARAGIAPAALAPREGLSLVSNPCTANAIAALGAGAAETSFAAAQTAACLTLEGYRANLGQIRAEVLALRPQPGQAAAAAGLHARLAGSGLYAPGAPRRLQDPLSIRHVVQVQGAVRAALDWLDAALAVELNSAPDSPAVLTEREEVLSQGGYLTPHLTVALVALNQALVQQAAQITARVGKLMATRFTDLPRALLEAGSDAAGMGPVMKTAEALYGEIAHLAQPAQVYPGLSADGLEDTITLTAIPAQALHRIVSRLERLIAIELIAATQAVELRDLGEDLAPALAPAMAAVRAISPPVTADRPLGAEIEALAGRIAAGDFSAPAREAGVNAGSARRTG